MTTQTVTLTKAQLDLVIEALEFAADMQLAMGEEEEAATYQKVVDVIRRQTSKEPTT